MPRRSLLRASSFALAATMLLAALPGPALGLEPPRPLPSYRPEFVTEVEQGVLQDCLWASSAMLIDKWTNGANTISRERLRTLSGDRRGGSNFKDVRAAFAKIGVRFRYSPNGGDPMTWNDLLGRLSRGAGAVVLGDDHALPRWLGRWDPAFWRKKGGKDNHALYLDGYDRRSGRIFLMDPLAPAGWGGEWVPASAIRSFIWTRGGRVFAATTPVAKRAPFAGVKVGAAAIGADSASIRIAWPTKRKDKHWRLPKVDVHSTVEPLHPDDRALINPLDDVIVAAPVESAAHGAGKPIAWTDHRIVVTIPTPTTPGAYRVSTALTERRFGHRVASSGTRIVYVPGERWAEYAVPGRLAAEVGDAVTFAVVVTNRGSVPWTTPARDVALPASEVPAPNARLVGTWIQTGGDPVGAAPHAVVLGMVPLEVGEATVVQSTIKLPRAAGTWTLVVSVVDDIAGSYAAIGSVPGRIVFDVAAPEADAPIR